MKVDVYRSAKKDLLYLYVTAEDGLSRVPEALLARFGEPEKTLSFELTAERTLARENPETVRRNLASEGYHLQLPPADPANSAKAQAD